VLCHGNGNLLHAALFYLCHKFVKTLFHLSRSFPASGSFSRLFPATLPYYSSAAPFCGTLFEIISFRGGKVNVHKQNHASLVFLI
ncbi:MAG: hypothetical protein J6Q02_00355, partial [Lachnospiraceae bacterium]|nr:hypothetical protein [Lachnospiraceae bacterium]